MIAMTAKCTHFIYYKTLIYAILFEYCGIFCFEVFFSSIRTILDIWFYVKGRVYGNYYVLCVYKLYLTCIYRFMELPEQLRGPNI